MNEIAQKKYAALKEILNYIKSRTYLNQNPQKDMLFITQKFEDAENYSKQLGVELPNTIYLKLSDRYFRQIEASRLSDIIMGEAAIQTFLNPVETQPNIPKRSLESAILLAA